MAGALTSLRARRWRAALLTLAVAAILALWFGSRSLALLDVAFLSGWLLLGLVAVLSLFNRRKKLPYPPLLRASTWLQWHIYLGLLALFVFLMHLGWRWPDSGSGFLLGGMFVLVALSGVVGIALSRRAPSALTVRGQEVIFERIPMFYRQLREEGEALIVEAARESRATTLPEFYRRRASPFLATPQDALRHLMHISRRCHRLRAELDSLTRYLDERERALAQRLDKILEAKDALDYHRALQGAMKLWLFVHIPATCALLVLVVVHVVLVHAFGRGL
ncbi:MAG: hypothetical protein WBV61_04825 [Rhodanobacteraceae bacterium]